MRMNFIGLLILSILWLGFIFFDSGNAFALENNNQSLVSFHFITSGIIPVLIGWSVFLMLAALIERKSQNI